MRNVLLTVSGLAPQIITETIYALLHQGRKVDAVRVITTRQGRDRIFTGLFSPESRVLTNLLADFGLTRADLDFSSDNIQVLKTADGIELDDIISREDNEILLKNCLNTAFNLTKEKNTAVWFLVAGGRKTMTSCLTLAAQLYGRPQDRLLHVLVSPEFENSRGFWYPPHKTGLIKLHDSLGQPFYKESRFAKVRLITIPFISVRHLLAAHLLDQPRPPAELMQSMIRDPQRTLLVNLAEGKIVFNSIELDMHPARLALYAFFIERKKKCALEKSCRGCNDCYLETTAIIADREVTEMYRRIPGSRLLNEMSGSGISSLSKENFNSYKSKIRKDILNAFGQTHLNDLEISSSGERPQTRYGIALERKLIRLEW